MPTTTVLEYGCENPLASTTQFRAGMAESLEDLLDCQRLRYLVFNCELGEGLESSAKTQLDRDQFDFICDHLLVRDTASGKLVGTYRMQSGFRAKGNLGYYSEQFFDFAPFEEIRAEVLELGRACVHPDYRNTAVLHMLWKGIMRYALSCKARYLLGCSSMTSQNENEGIALYENLREKYLIDPRLRTTPKPGFACLKNNSAAPVQFPNHQTGFDCTKNNDSGIAHEKIHDSRAARNQAKETEPASIKPPAPTTPRLFRAYLDVSARLCGPPAIDRDFKTIDFLTLIDLHHIPDRLRTRLF
jgi:putative hemolysin